MISRISLTLLVSLTSVSILIAQDSKNDHSISRICFAGDKLTDLKSEAQRANLKNETLRELAFSKQKIVAIIMDFTRDDNKRIEKIVISDVRDDKVLIQPYLTLRRGEVDFDKVVNGLARYTVD